MNLLISLQSETLKTKRTAAFYFTLAGAAVVPFIFLLNAFTDGMPDGERGSKDPLNAIFKIAAEMTGIGILPLFVILVCALLPQTEFKNNTWKQVYASPQTRLNVFTAKFLNTHFLILLFFVANHLFMWIVISAMHFIIPDLSLLHRPLDWMTILTTTANSYLTVLGICAIQFWLGLRFRNFIVPIAIGLVLWLTGTVMALEYHSSWAHYFPYSFHTFGFSSDLRPHLSQVVWKSIGCACIFLVAGFADFKRRKING